VQETAYTNCSATAIASMPAKNFKSGAIFVDGATFDMDWPMEDDALAVEVPIDMVMDIVSIDLADLVPDAALFDFPPPPVALVALLGIGTGENVMVMDGPLVIVSMDMVCRRTMSAARAYAGLAAGTATLTAGAAGAAGAAPPPPMVKSMQDSYVCLMSGASQNHWITQLPAWPHCAPTSGMVTVNAVLFGGMVCELDA